MRESSGLQRQTDRSHLALEPTADDEDGGAAGDDDDCGEPSPDEPWAGCGARAFSRGRHPALKNSTWKLRCTLREHEEQEDDGTVWWQRTTTTTTTDDDDDDDNSGTRTHNSSKNNNTQSSSPSPATSA
jgi:hypothetical protein